MVPSDFTIHNRYRILYVVDERPGSKIYRGRDEQTGRLMLIAALPNESGDDIAALASQVAKARHAVILPVTDHFAEGDSYYLVCEDISGQDLDRTLRARGGPLPEAEALKQLPQLLDALEFTHGQRPPLYLGDPLPSDLWIGEDGSWRLTPFTFVRRIGRTPSPYRPSELAVEHGEPTTASDLYALMALLYHALTGWAPPTVEQQQAGTPLNGPRTLNPAISPLMEQVLLRGLQLRPENRYQQARELKLALEMVQMMDGRPAMSGPALSTTATPAPPAPPPGYPHGVYAAPAPSYPPAQTAAYPQAPGQPYPPGIYPAPEKPRKLSTGCLVALAVALTLTSVAICAALAWFIPGSPLPGLFATRATQAPASPSPEPTTAAAANATSVAAPTGVLQATLEPANVGPRAITMQNASQITQTHVITGPVLGPLSFSPDGKTLAVGISNIVNLRNADTLENLEPPVQLEGHVGEVFALAWSPDGKLLASGAYEDRNIRLWEPATGKLVRTLTGQDGWTRSLAFSPDGTTLAAGSTDNAIWLWDVASGDVLQTFEGHTDWVGGVVFSPDGQRLASASRDGSVRLWDIAAGKQHDDFSFQVALNPNTNTRYWTNGVAFSPDGKLLAVGSTDRIVHLLDATTGEEQHKLEGHTNWIIIRGVVFTPDGKTLATAGFDGTIRLWDPSTGRETGRLEGHRFQIAAISFSPDGQRLASASDQEGQLVLWDMQTEQVKTSLRIGQGLITALTFSHDGTLLGAVGYNGTVRLHQIEQNRARTFFGSARASQPLAFLPDGRIVAIGDEDTIGVVDPNAAEGTPLGGLDGSPFNVATSRDGKLIAAGSSTGTIGLWDGATGAAKSPLKTDLPAIYALAISPDGSQIAAAGPPTDPRVQIWDVATGKLRWTFEGTNAAISSLVFQPRGNLLAAADFEGSLRLWNVENGQLVRTIAADQDRRWFGSITFSPDGTMLITGSANGDLVFWDAGTGAEAVNLPLSIDAIFSLAISPDGQRLAVGLGDESVRIFELAAQ